MVIDYHGDRKYSDHKDGSAQKGKYFLLQRDLPLILLNYCTQLILKHMLIITILIIKRAIKGFIYC